MKASKAGRISVLFIGILMMFLTSTVLFAKEPVNLSDDAVTIKSSDGTLTNYPTLDQAARAAKDGDTILLNEDIEMSFYTLDGRQQNPMMTIEGKTVTLDGQGHTVTAKDEAFSMIEVRPGGELTIRNIVLDGSSANNRKFSNIVNIEGGYVTIEDQTILQNNRTAAISIGTNVPGGTCVMNGGEIRNNVMPGGSNDTGVAVTILEESTFIMNGGSIHDNQTLNYGSSGIMANRGGRAVLNGGEIYGNRTQVSGMASAVHIKGGTVDLNGAEIYGNTSVSGYGALYVTNHSSFGTKWDGILNINGGSIHDNTDEEGNENAIYLWSRSSIEGTGAYLRFSGSPNVEGPSVIYANSSSSVDFQPLEVIGTFTPVTPIQLDTLFYYVLGQRIVNYTDGLMADHTHFINISPYYGYQESEDQTYLYTEAKRPIVFMDGEEELEALADWAFVEDTIAEPENVDKAGYRLAGWYTDAQLSDPWDFATDLLPREEGDFLLYAKWEALPVELPELSDSYTLDMPCQDTEITLTPDFEEASDQTYAYEWKDAEGNIIAQTRSLVVDDVAEGELGNYTLTVTVKRSDNGESGSVTSVYTVRHAAHDISEEWKMTEETHYKECLNCGEIFAEAEHSFVWVTDQEPAIGIVGYRHEECSICGFEKEPVEIPALEEERPIDPDDGKPVKPETPGSDEEADDPNESAQTAAAEHMATLPMVLLAVSLGGVYVAIRRRNSSAEN